MDGWMDGCTSSTLDTVIFRSIGVLENPKTVLLSVLPLPIVRGLVGKGVLAEAISFTVLVLTWVGGWMGGWSDDWL